jgi:lipopolysaccharide export system protein LptA
MWHFFNDKNKEHKRLFFCLLCFFILCSAFGNLTSLAVDLNNESLGALSRQTDKTDTVSRIYLVHTDVLYKTRMDQKAEILVGNVQLSHKGAILFCDSARFYRADNSFDAYGRVKMVQGDTLKLLSDTLYYKGNDMVAHSIGNVRLYHKESRLETTFLDYFRTENLGVYHDGGTLYDKDNVLCSDWGQYSPTRNEAMFADSVILTNPNFVMKTNMLYYYTDTEIAKIVSPTEITTSDGTFVYSENGRYDTRNSWADLLDRSYIIKDMRRIEGDSLHYDDTRNLSEAFGQVVINDADNYCMLLGNRCEYNDSTGYAMATDSAVLLDYSSLDTMYVHGDTLKMFTYNMNTDSVYRNLHIYHKVRMFRNDIQGVCDSLVMLSKDSCTYLYGQPILWNESQQIFGEEIRVYNNDSTIDWVHIVNQAMTIEKVDSVSYNQVASREMFSFFSGGEIEHTEAHGNVYVAYFIDEDNGARIGMNYTETSKMHLYLKDRKVHKIWMPSSTGVIYPPTQIPQDRRYLTGFAWFDYIRPKNKEDIFVWQSKSEKDMLKATEKRNVPLQKLNDIK